MKMHDTNRRDELPVFLAPNNLHVLVLTPDQLELLAAAVGAQYEAATVERGEDDDEDAWSELLDIVDGKEQAFVVPNQQEGRLLQALGDIACLPVAEPTWAAWVAGKS